VFSGDCTKKRQVWVEAVEPTRLVFRVLVSSGLRTQSVAGFRLRARLLKVMSFPVPATWRVLVVTLTVIDTVPPGVPVPEPTSM